MPHFRFLQLGFWFSSGIVIHIIIPTPGIVKNWACTQIFFQHNFHTLTPPPPPPPQKKKNISAIWVIWFWGVWTNNNLGLPTPWNHFAFFLKWFWGPWTIFWEVVHDIQNHFSKMILRYQNCCWNDFLGGLVTAKMISGGLKSMLEKWFQGVTVPDHPRIISEMISRGGEVQPPEGRGDWDLPKRGGRNTIMPPSLNCKALLLISSQWNLWKLPT